jgi:hypothetical protein
VVDFIGAPERIRTSDPQIRSLVLYPAELPVLAWYCNDLVGVSCQRGRLGPAASACGLGLAALARR